MASAFSTVASRKAIELLTSDLLKDGRAAVRADNNGFRRSRATAETRRAPTTESVSIDLTLLNIYKKMGEAEGNDHAV